MKKSEIFTELSVKLAVIESKLDKVLDLLQEKKEFKVEWVEPKVKIDSFNPYGVGSVPLKISGDLSIE